MVVRRRGGPTDLEGVGDVFGALRVGVVEGGLVEHVPPEGGLLLLALLVLLLRKLLPKVKSTGSIQSAQHPRMGGYRIPIPVRYRGS